MNRRHFGRVLASTAVGGAGVAFVMQTTRDRVDQLEDTVAVLDYRVSVLETQAAATTEVDSVGSPVTDESSAESGAFIASGTGDALSETFRLEAAQYRARGSFDNPDDYDNDFIVTLFGPDAYEEIIFSGYAPAEGTFTGATTLDIEVAGEYFVGLVSLKGDWTVEFEQL